MTIQSLLLMTVLITLEFADVLYVLNIWVTNLIDDKIADIVGIRIAGE